MRSKKDIPAKYHRTYGELRAARAAIVSATEWLAHGRTGPSPAQCEAATKRALRRLGNAAAELQQAVKPNEAAAFEQVSEKNEAELAQAAHVLYDALEGIVGLIGEDGFVSMTGGNAIRGIVEGAKRAYAAAQA